jgi:adenosylcobinamide-phosphate synthase
MEFQEAVVVLAAALVWDLVFGEVAVAIHPVVWIGKLIRWGELLWFREEVSRGQQLALGFLLVFLCVTVSLLTYWAVEAVLLGVPWLSSLFAVFVLKSSFALRELGAAAYRVRDALFENRLADARYELRCLCSRDASQLTERELVGATCSSLGENLADSLVAPLFYYALFGVPGALAYRVVNTMDARIGYRGKYEAFGKGAARIDDVLGFIPARLTAGLILVAGACNLMPVRRGAFITIRDRKKTPSPNGGWPMAALAGVLEVELEKPASYRLGDPVKSLSPATIEAAWHVTVLTAFLFSSLLLLHLIFGRSL